jgi:aspartate-semialdehyde dehydrogenase
MQTEIGILGATGMVGQRFVQLLQNHPWFKVGALLASERSAGKPYGEASVWRLPGEPLLQDMTVLPCTPASGLPRVLFSALDKAAALELEPAFVAAGYRVISNASAFRMDPRWPLLIPEVNPDHLALVEGAARQGDGYLVTNPNCTCIPAVMVLKPLQEAFGVKRVLLASYQAVSGAGYPGESAWDILGTVKPHPGDEEAKVAEEPKKLLGSFKNDGVELAPFKMSARCVRVPVADGHLVGVSVELGRDVGVEEVVGCLREWKVPVEIPSSPRPLFRILSGRDRPSPRLDAEAGGGMAISVGRVEACEVLGIKFFALAHNAIRGAAGCAIGNAELLREKGML